MKHLQVRIGGSADHGFDQPLGLLSDCHRRIERFLDALLVVARTRHGESLGDADRRVLEQALWYFATAAPRHTADEEASLFPRLRAASDARAREAFATLDALEADHRDAEARHAAVDRLMRRWLADNRLSGDELAEVIGHLEALEAAYARHIGIEDRQLFPAAATILGADDLEAVGREMADRRGVPFQPPAELRR